jgi:DNA-binding MarR family transcriptional regulator
MPATTSFPKETAHEVRDRCLCFAAQRSARELARRFDRLFAGLDLTNGQFSMMVTMGGMGAPKLGQLARFLAMDHATVTAAVRKLEKRGLVSVGADASDRRARRVSLTGPGVALIARAMPLWRQEHARLDEQLGEAAPEIRGYLARLVPPAGPPPAGPRNISS